MNRYVLSCLLVAGAGLSAPARAQEYPYCLEPSAFTVGTCSFETMAQCMASAAGNNGVCVSNPRYVAPRPEPVQPAPVPPAKQSKGRKAS